MDTDRPLDMTPLCWCCGEAMEFDDDWWREVELEGGEITVHEPNWRCVNPTCDCCDETEHGR